MAFWIGESSLFLGGKIPNISKNGKIPPEVLENKKLAPKLKKFRDAGLIVDSLDEKTTANLAVKMKIKEARAMLKVHQKLSDERAKLLLEVENLKKVNAQLKIEIGTARKERDAAMAAFKRLNSTKGG